MLSVEHTPGETALGARHVTCVRPFWPWRFEWTAFAGQCAQQAAKGVGAVATHARDVFPDNRSGWTLILLAGLVADIGKLHIPEGSGAARVGQTLACAGAAERFARGSAHENVRSDN